MDGHLAYGPEHVANAGQRFSGRFVDNMAFMVSLFGGLLLGRAISPAVMGVLTLIGVGGYFAGQVYLVRKTGQSLGKRVAGTIVVRTDGSPAGVFRAFVGRDLLILVAGATRIFGLINALMVFSELRRTGHDRILGTVVLDINAARSIGVDAEAVADVFR